MRNHNQFLLEVSLRNTLIKHSNSISHTMLFRNYNTKIQSITFNDLHQYHSSSTVIVVKLSLLINTNFNQTRCALSKQRHRYKFYINKFSYIIYRQPQKTLKNCSN
jgi:hypothetical protein